MAFVLAPFRWFYHEFGLVSIHETGRNAYLIILARACRMLAYGTNALVLALFFSELHFPDSRIGLFMTLTILGDVFLGGALTLVADRFGRRRILLAGSALMVLGGLIFSLFENFWVLLAAAVVGVISATGGDFGPFRAVEESILSHLTSPDRRADVLAWYVTASTLGSAVGSEVSGRLVHALQGREGWGLVDAYHALFWMYTSMGVVNAVITLLLTEDCEAAGGGERVEAEYVEVGRSPDIDLEEAEDTAESHPALPSESRPSKARTAWSWFSTRLSTISKPTRSVMYTLWFLLAIDSLADGMVPYTLTNYYIDQKFSPRKSTLGDVTAIAYFLGACSAIFAAPLARHIGLINTMVFTHIPSSTAVLFFPFPSNLALTVLLLLVRAGLNNMDQAPRTAFISAVVRPEERTAVMGITTIVRTLAAMSGPSITGMLAGGGRFWIAFVAAGVLRLGYDGGLYGMFVNQRLYEYEAKVERRGSGDEERFELDDLPSEDDDDDYDDEGEGEGEEVEEGSGLR